MQLLGPRTRKISQIRGDDDVVDQPPPPALLRNHFMITSSKILDTYFLAPLFHPLGAHFAEGSVTLDDAFNFYTNSLSRFNYFFFFLRTGQIIVVPEGVFPLGWPQEPEFFVWN